VIEGQTVNKGQLLARIDPRDYQIALEETKAKFDKAQSDFRRYQNLYEREAVPLSDLEYYRAMRDVAKAKLDKSQADMEDTRLTAPFSGRIGETYVENFEEVRANQDILSLNDVRRIQIVMDLPEYLLTNVRTGERVKMAARFEALPEKEFPVSLYEAAAQADPRTRTYRVTVMMDQPEEINVLPGMTAEIRLYGELQRTAKDMTFAVPADAVFAGDERDQYVWKVDSSGMTVHRTRVEVGEITGEGYITIFEGLVQGDLIVAAGVSQLREGMKVRFLDE
jgi:RND family efflux transporter MFP subunit